MSGLFACSQPQQNGGTVKTISATEYKQQTDKEGMLVDVRTTQEFNDGHLTGSENYDYLDGTFAKSIQNWDKDKTYYLYCKSGNRSGKAAQLMKEAGFKNIYNIGGYEDLKSAGLPVEK